MVGSEERKSVMAPLLHPVQADSSPSSDADMVHSIAAGLSEMAEAVAPPMTRLPLRRRMQATKASIFRPFNRWLAKPSSRSRQGRRTSPCRAAMFSRTLPRQTLSGNSFA